MLAVRVGRKMASRIPFVGAPPIVAMAPRSTVIPPHLWLHCCSLPSAPRVGSRNGSTNVLHGQ